MVDQPKMMFETNSGKLMPFRSKRKMKTPPCSWENAPCSWVETKDQSFVFRNETYSSASDALNSYIDDFETTLMDSGITLDESNLCQTIEVMECELLNLSTNEADSSIVQLLTSTSPKKESPKRRSLPSPSSSPFYSPTEKLSRTPSPFSKLAISVPYSKKSPIKKLELPDSPLQQVEDIVFNARISGHATKLAPSWVEDLANTEITSTSTDGKCRAPSWVNELVNATRKYDLDQYKLSSSVPDWVNNVGQNNLESSQISDGPGLTLNDLKAESPKQVCRSKLYDQKIKQVRTKTGKSDNDARLDIGKMEILNGHVIPASQSDDSSGFQTEETDTEIMQIVSDHIKRDRLANPKREESRQTLATDNTDYLLSQKPADNLTNPERQISGLTLATDDTDYLLSKHPLYELNRCHSSSSEPDLSDTNIVRSAMLSKDYKPKGSVSWSDQPKTRYVSRLERKLASEVSFEALKALKTQHKIRQTARKIKSEVIQQDLDKKKLNLSADDDSLSGDRSWEVRKPYKPPVPVRSSPGKNNWVKNNNVVQEFIRDCLVEKGFEGTVKHCLSGRSHPGSMEALKNMLFSLQNLEAKSDNINEKEEITLEKLQELQKRSKMENITPKKDIIIEDLENNQGSQSLRKAFSHLQNLRNLVSTNDSSGLNTSKSFDS